MLALYHSTDCDDYYDYSFAAVEVVPKGWIKFVFFFTSL